MELCDLYYTKEFSKVEKEVGPPEPAFTLETRYIFNMECVAQIYAPYHGTLPPLQMGGICVS